MIHLLLLMVAVSGSARAAHPPEVEAVLASARQAGLPTELLEAKAAEGAAKGVPSDRVVTYLEGLRGDLIRADALLGGASGPDRAALLAGSAAALRAGGSTRAVVELAAGPPSLRAQAVRGFADLLAAGCPEPGALTLVRGAVRQPDPTTALRVRLETTFSLLAQGEPVGTALERGTTADHDPPAWGAGGGKDEDKDKDKDKDKEPPGKAKGHDKK